MRRYKVLLFTPYLQQGGAERQIIELMSRLPERFEPILCLCREPTHYTEYLPPGQPRHILGTDAMLPRGLARLVKVIRSEKPDIVHSYREIANHWMRIACLMAPAPVVLTSVRTPQLEPITTLAEPILSRISDRVLTNSETIRSALIRKTGLDPKKIQVIHNFIDLTKFHPPSATERREARRQFGLADDDLVMVLPGRVHYQKNQLGLAWALHLLRRRGRLPSNLRVLFAGRNHGENIPGKIVVHGLPRLVRFLRLEDQVTLLGSIGNMVPVYHAADIVTLPSFYEGIPNVVLESHASGLPVVVSHAANADGAILPDKSGIVINPWRSGELADALDSMFQKSTSELRQIGLAGRAHVERRFDAEAILGQVVSLYDSLLAAKGVA